MANSIHLKDLPETLVGGQFRVIVRLGEGGMGEVYLAEQVNLGRKVVLKLVHAHLLANRAELEERCAREARALAQINHPNVVQLYAYGTAEDGRPYFAMEYIDGRTLAEELQRGPLLEHRALRIAAAVADAMAAAHAAGIVHRDLKPANVMLADRHGDPDFVKVLDFGIAKMSGQGSKLTATGAFFGTPEYVAPEQALGQLVTAATDVYALGTMLFEMLTGRALFEGGTPFEVIQKHVSTPPPRPSSVKPGLSPAADAIVLRCLAKSPVDRFSSASSLAVALRDAASTAKAAPTNPPPLAVGSTAILAQDSGCRHPGPLAARADEIARESATASKPRARVRWGGVLAILALGGLAGGWYLIAGARQGGGRRVLPSAVRSGLSASRAPEPPPVGPTLPPYPPQAAETKHAPHPSKGAHPPGGTGIGGKGRPETGTAELPNLAVDNAIVSCLNRHSERGWSSFYRYLSWVNPAVGPTGHETNIYGVYTLYDTKGCARAIDELSAGAAKRTGAARFVAAVEKLAQLTIAADAYYEPDDWKDDGMARGKTMHQPLMDAFREFAAADRALRVRLTAAAVAHDRHSLEAGQEPLSAATVRLRLAARTLAQKANVPWRKLVTLDRGALQDALEQTAQAAAAFAGLAQAAGSDASDVASKANELLVSAHQLRRRLGPRPGWSTGERMNLNNQLAQWMVTGSPAQLVRSYNGFVDALNRAHLTPGLEATLVHLEPPVSEPSPGAL